MWGQNYRKSFAPRAAKESGWAVGAGDLTIVSKVRNVEKKENRILKFSRRNFRGGSRHVQNLECRGTKPNGSGEKGEDGRHPVIARSTDFSSF